MNVAKNMTDSEARTMVAETRAAKRRGEPPPRIDRIDYAYHPLMRELSGGGEKK